MGFVLYAYPWGVEGTALEHEAGPDEWQLEVLNDIKRGVLEKWPAIMEAVASGHGIGKSALIAWIIQWFLSTRSHPQVVVTANTASQLASKTWRELAKWHKLSINGHWFTWTATKFYLRDHPETWFASALTWNKDKAEAFAGTHERDVLLIYDEASMIDDAIWEVSDGAMSTKGAIWIAFGNPTRNTGRFHACFHRLRHRWRTRQIDSRTCKMADKAWADRLIEDFGDDSDYVRVRVKGIFPRASSAQFIGSDLVEAARGRHISEDSYRHAPKILMLDVARHGDDQSVILRRQGLACTGLRKLRVGDTMTLAGLLAQEIEDYKPDAVFVDATGIGWGVVDRLRQLGHSVIAVQTGEGAIDSKAHFNLRAEMWSKMRDWLKEGGCLPDDQELCDDLTGPMYSFDAKERVALERKEDMKRRGLASPDCADALALSFAQAVAVKPSPGSLEYALEQRRSAYDPLEHLS